MQHASRLAYSKRFWARFSSATRSSKCELTVLPQFCTWKKKCLHVTFVDTVTTPGIVRSSQSARSSTSLLLPKATTCGSLHSVHITRKDSLLLPRDRSSFSPSSHSQEVNTVCIHQQLSATEISVVAQLCLAFWFSIFILPQSYNRVSAG